jgi:uncharacterized membrane protein
MTKRIWLLIMIVLYLAAGINHFVNPTFYTGLMPSWLPEHKLMNTLSGIAEIVLAVLLIIPQTQRFSAWMIQLMLFIFLVCIHVPMAMDFHGWEDLEWWIAIIRLAAQYWLLRWAWWYTHGKPINLLKNTSNS